MDVHAPLNNVIAGLLAYRWLTSSNRPLPAAPSRLGCRNVSGTPLASTRRRKEKEESLEERKKEPDERTKWGKMKKERKKKRCNNEPEKNSNEQMVRNKYRSRSKGSPEIISTVKKIIQKKFIYWQEHGDIREKRKERKAKERKTRKSRRGKDGKSDGQKNGKYEKKKK